MSDNLLRPDTSPAAYAALTVAEAEAAGFNGLEVTCACLRPVCLPFRFMRERLRVRRDAPIAALATRLRCKSCGRRASHHDVRLWYLQDYNEKPRVTRPTLAECIIALQRQIRGEKLEC